ncbi:hypothetical protein GWK47_047412 [Chionoecetes opilio]|uniref:Uncharacterized protein n=1 Tax=Chionoecetes opilio TaxID=41210 RepID=A0A8J4YB66_CHIOP|nr:hypothetical protein GWK47_047412 [Chionoecetes opilio]
MGEEEREEIKSILKDLPHVATTGDSWTAHNRSFIGRQSTGSTPLTCRKRATLAIKEIKLSYNLRLARPRASSPPKLDQVTAPSQTRGRCPHHHANGANYVAAFSNYGSGVGEAEEDATNPDVRGGDQQPKDQEAGERALTSSASPWPLLQQLQWEDSPGCPSIKDAGNAHTVNLLASIDVSQVHTGTVGGPPPFKKTLARAQGLWNLQKRSSTHQPASSKCVLLQRVMDERRPGSS